MLRVGVVCKLRSARHDQQVTLRRDTEWVGGYSPEADQAERDHRDGFYFPRSLSFMNSLSNLPYLVFLMVAQTECVIFSHEVEFRIILLLDCVKDLTVHTL